MAGRPLSENPKTFKVQVRLTAAQYSHLTGEAEAMGLTLAEYFRLKALPKRLR